MSYCPIQQEADAISLFVVYTAMITAGFTSVFVAMGYYFVERLLSKVEKPR